ncbi:MAG: glutamyl-tRNA(Gln) amidotransferase subunit A protein [Candidatus Shapirobacteria bacterium GW2011_GWF1_38_23]|nr:MAG: glutamyl-tRNA(Gln) amidotransferase subunit A protein [Candidatus Shapirobacteria bacterium GW2011_GWF2_37_20]KKQ63102.1 MAG: glutamyl-tRNA(Gln) amidotransferase subunit A protein [Candidatus Shapirobacteria bacterium GW2011_GWF1_38_23]
MTDLNKLTLKEAREGLLSKKFTAVELTQSCLDRIKSLDKKLNSFVTVTGEDALKQAQSVDINLPLGGIPIAVKDNYLTKDIRTTASSRVLDNYLAQYDATTIKKLKNAGAIIIGKTNLDAWAHGSSTETSDYGPTLNPWNMEHLPGGSSGGSAAAVAADETIISVGSETAGSIRQPASWCGVVGFKPTYGRVSRYGVIAMKSSTDSPGPICKTVDDAANLLEIMSGSDPFDATSIDEPPWKKPELRQNLKGLKIGLPLSYFPPQTQPEVKEAILGAVETLKKLGAEIIELSDVLDPKYSIAVYTILQRSEVSSNLARFDGIRYGHDRSFFGTEAKRRIMLGTYSLSAGYYDAYYLKAQKVRTLICQDFDNQFKKVDAIIGPVSPTTALKIGASEGQSMFGEIQDMLVEPSSIAGLPGISIPCAFDKIGLPIGLQIMAPQKREDLVYQIAKLFEDNTDYHLERPKL